MYEILRLTRTVIFAVVVVLGALLLIAVGREQANLLRSASAYPPTGRLIPVADRQMHIDCRGEGKPTVIFESERDLLGSLSWTRVHERVGETTRACTYDRAGIMWSEAGPLPRDGRRIREELAALLEAAGETGPYVLVGHGIGSVYAHVFTGAHPRQVCGVVMVDPAPIEHASDEDDRPSAALRPLVKLLSHTGLQRGFSNPRPRTMPPETYRSQQAFMPASAAACFEEQLQMRRTRQQASEIAGLGHLPLIVLSPTRPPSRIEWTDAYQQRQWNQRELAALSTNGQLRRISGAGHYPQFDRPEVVVEAVEDVVDECRTKGLIAEEPQE